MDCAQRIVFQSPAGDSLSCDHPAGGGIISVQGVSIARRRFVVLRRPADTCVSGAGGGFQSPAGDSLSCDMKEAALLAAVLLGFNRPQAIRCLATGEAGEAPWIVPRVSIARRRFVVLRHLGEAGEAPWIVVSIARRRFVVLRHRCPHSDRRFVFSFQSPAGDSLSCDRGKAGGGHASTSCFNRPQAIRCLATCFALPACAVELGVSIARRRFVVLRHRNGGLVRA